MIVSFTIKETQKNTVVNTFCTHFLSTFLSRIFYNEKNSAPPIKNNTKWYLLVYIYYNMYYSDSLVSKFHGTYLFA